LSLSFKLCTFASSRRRVFSERMFEHTCQ
jgi:hypothetical protein